MDNRSAKVAKAFTMGPLKFAVALLPYSLILNSCPNAKTAQAVGLGLGVVCAQFIPPRQSIRSALLWGAGSAIIWWLIAAFELRR